MKLAAPYMGTPKILTCPSSQKNSTTNFTISNPSDAMFVSYTYHVGATTSLVWQADPNEVIMWDQGVVGKLAGTNGGVGLVWALTSNHKGAGGNVLFNDGHVAFHSKTPTNMPLGCQNP